MLAGLRKLRRPVPFAAAVLVIIAVPAGLLFAAAPRFGSFILKAMLVALAVVFLARVMGPRINCGRRLPPRPVSAPAPVRRCPKCGYDLDGLPLRDNEVLGMKMVRVVCPECGWAQW